MLKNRELEKHINKFINKYESHILFFLKVIYLIKVNSSKSQKNFL